MTVAPQPQEATEDYKTIRLREIRDIIWADYNALFEHNELLLAHLYTENGALAEDRHGDQQCSLGIIQWNTCVHSKMNVNRFLEKHPEFREWRYQVRFYLDRMSERLAKYGSIDRAIESWNPGGKPWYLQKVKRNVGAIRSILN